MVLPLCLHSTFVRHEAFSASGRRARLRASGALAFWLLTTFLLVAGLLASKSRAGVLIGVFVSVLAIALHVRAGRASWWSLPVTTLVAIAAFLAVGPQSLTARFLSPSGGSDLLLRWEIVRSSWQGIKAFWPIGSGWGSYDAVYARFRPAPIVEFVGYAHNDYVQGVLEGGVLFPALLLMASMLVVRRLRQQTRGSARAFDDGSAEDLPLWATGLGILALALHCLVDFNAHIPANAMVGALLLGAFLREPAREKRSS